MTTSNSESTLKSALPHRKLSLTTVGNSSQSNLNANHFKLKHSFDKRKVSLSFLTSYNNLKIPHHFFAILEDIRAGLYPRLFKEIDSNDLNLDSISSTSCLDFVLQQKHIIDSIDRRLSVPSGFLMTRNKSDSNLKRHYVNTTGPCPEQNGEDSKSSLPLVECRRLASENCTIKMTPGEMIELRLSLKFNDEVCRSLRSYFPRDFLNYLKDDYNPRSESSPTTNVHLFKHNIDLANVLACDEKSFEEKIENICNHLANELIDYGLINSLDHHLISELFAKTIKEYLFSLL